MKNLILFLLLAFLASCNGGGGGASSTTGGEANPVDPLLPPKISFSGSISSTINTPIGSVIPINEGGQISSCSINPSLPSGLQISNECIISGTPLAASALTSYTITATNFTGSSSTTISITINNVGPTISSISPNKGSLSGGRTVTILGSGFDVGMTIELGGVSCTSVNIVSSTEATCTTGASSTASSVELIVSLSAGSASLPNSFTYYAPLSLSPSSSTLAVSNSLSVSASGGSGSYTYSIVEAQGGSINSSTGAYIAPNVAGSYTIRVSDEDGNHADSVVTVNSALTAASLSFGLKINGTRNIVASGGVPPYSFTTSSGSISSSGLFTAPATTGVANITLKDSLNNSVTIIATITAILSASPTSAVVTIGNQKAFVISGGSSPYSASLIGTNGTITSSGSTVTFTSTTGRDETLRVTDANGESFDVSITGRRPVSISAGSYSSHTCATFSDGTVQCWGGNGSGQLGNNTKVNSSTPVLVSGLTSAINSATGASHSCSVLSDGTAKCWGNGSSGILGNNTTTSSLTPVSVTGTGFSSIGAGANFSCGLTTAGVVKCWGENTDYYLGRYTYEQTLNSSNVTQKIPYIVSYAPAAFSTLAVGSFNACAITSSSKTVYCWGANNYGQLGVCSNTSSNLILGAVSGVTNAVSVGVGSWHGCALKADGTVMCWGGNTLNQLGASSTICANGYSAVSLTGITGATSLAVGDNHSCAILSNGTAKCWGENSNGQLGNNSITATSTPVAVNSLTNISKITIGNLFTCALDSANKVWCWGNNSNGKLGDGSAVTKSLVPVQVGPWK